MTTKTINLIISDIDGTVLDHQHQPDQDLAAKIDQLRELGIPFVLASARSPLGMTPIAEALGIADYPMACYNGALLTSKKGDQLRTLFEHPLDKSEVTVILQGLREHFPQIAINLYSGQDWLVEEIDDWVSLEADITKEVPRVIDFAQVLSDDERAIHKLLLIDQPAEIEAALSYLQGLGLADASFYLSKSNYLEVTSSQVSKEQALVELARYYQTPLDATMAIGDNYNDLPMIKLAGLGIAMDNAPQPVKEAADAVTLSHRQKGVSQAIEAYVLGKSL